ncbi:MAG: hypothetical protein KAI03_06715 [Candidatus Aureabacteria bacterium]|nr:hypothetical protein [Candidatus Auribacterota bacterium]
MTGKKKKLIILSALLVIVIFVWGRAFISPLRGKGNRPAVGVANSSSGKKISEDFLIQEVPKRLWAKSAYPSWGRDPFTVPKVSADISVELKLNGIMWDKDNPLTIINGKVLKKGDKIGTNTVIGIKQNRVFLSDGNREFELKLGK